MSNEPVVAWMFQHEETGRMSYVSNDGMNTPALFLSMNPRYTLVCVLYGNPVDDTALLRQALEALESVYPYTDSLICYASTVDEHPPNAIDGNVRDALTALRERLGEKV